VGILKEWRCNEYYMHIHTIRRNKKQCFFGVNEGKNGAIKTEILIDFGLNMDLNFKNEKASFLAGF